MDVDLTLALGQLLSIIIALVLKLACLLMILKLFTAITVAIALSLPVLKQYLTPIRKSFKGVE